MGKEKRDTGKGKRKSGNCFPPYCFSCHTSYLQFETRHIIKPEGLSYSTGDLPIYSIHLHIIKPEGLSYSTGDFLVNPGSMPPIKQEKAYISK